MGPMHALELDQLLMVRTAEGDADSLRILLDRHRDPIVYFLQRMVGRRDVAEELAQEVFLRVYQARAHYQPRAKFTTWLYRIALNQALNWRRNTRRERNSFSLDAPVVRDLRWQVADRAPTAEGKMLEHARYDHVRAAIAELPDRQRAAVLLHKYHEMDYHAIAAALGCSIPTVKSLLFRAYANLRMRLAPFAHQC